MQLLIVFALWGLSTRSPSGYQKEELCSARGPRSRPEVDSKRDMLLGSPDDVPAGDGAQDMDVVNQKDTVPFTTADGSTIRELLAHRNSAIRQQSLAEARLSPGLATTPHYHEVTEEIYYILNGQAEMTLGEETRAVGPGDAIAIPPGQRHTIRNTGYEELVFLCTCAPGYEHTDTFLEK